MRTRRLLDLARVRGAYFVAVVVALPGAAGCRGGAATAGGGATGGSPAAGDAYLGDIVGVVRIAFDRRTGASGSATQTIYVGVADKGESIYRTTDGGATFARLPSVDKADTIGFGKAAPGRSYPALYGSAQVSGTRGIYRSDDGGATWVRLTDDQHQFAMTNRTITGDPRIHGRVYVGTNGRGILYRDL